MFPVIGLGIFIIVICYMRNGSLCTFIKGEACLLEAIKGWLAGGEKYSGFVDETENVVSNSFKLINHCVIRRRLKTLGIEIYLFNLR